MLTSNWMFLCLWTAGLGLSSGYGYASRRVVVQWYHLLIIVLSAFMVCLFCTYCGRWMGEILPARFFEVVTGLGIMAVGVFIVILAPEYPGRRDLLLFVVAIELAVSGLGFQIGAQSGRGGLLSFMLSLMLLASIIGGFILGQKRISHWRIYYMKPYFSGLLLVFLGLVKAI